MSGLSLAAAAWALLQTLATGPGPVASELKRATARRVSTAPRIDGRLDDAAWTAADFYSDFRQKEPVENGEPSDRTEVAFLYDDRALYVGARMFAADPAAVPRDLTRRDQYGNTEHLTVSLDPFLDRRTAYSFSITAAGVRRDYYHPRDTEFPMDFTFDPVWDAKVAFDSTGWTAELRIPYSQLRFGQRPIQRWGVNLNRWVPHKNEDLYWVVVPRNQTGYASRFGILEGIEGIRPPRRIELAPYVASSGTIARTSDPHNALDPDGRSVSGRAGVDAKIGLGPSLTIEATVNPDFGQVEADPAVVNLTAFETFFGERRPFFTEGAQLLRSTVPDYFYSRRIGAPPRGRAAGDYVEAPANATILGAAKLTGRLGGGLSLGVLAALTDREFARTYDSAPGRFGRTQVAPRAQYGVARAERQFGRDASTVGVVVSAVNRDFGDDRELPALLAARAVAGGADWVLRFARGRYELHGDVGASRVEGDPAAITAIQRSAVHYLQRPDFRHDDVDPTATSLSGFRARLAAFKNAGDWLWQAEVSTQSPGFETNDVGRLTSADNVNWGTNLLRQWTVPGRVFRSAFVRLETAGNLNYDRVLTNFRSTLYTNQVWPSFLSTNLNVGCQVRAQSDVLTRGGPLMATPAGCEVAASVANNFAAGTLWRFGASASRTEAHDWQVGVNGGVTVRPSSRVSLSANPSYTRSLDTRQYLTTLGDGPAATYGRRYLFGAIRRSTVAAQFRVNYTVSPDLTLEGYAEPFAASGQYTEIGELAAPRTRTLRVYGRDGTTILGEADGRLEVRDDAGGGATFSAPVPDFSVLSFRSNLVLRWEWRPGSTLFVVWQQDRSSLCEPSDPAGCRAPLRPGTSIGLGGLAHALGAPGDNFFAIKLSYWLPTS